MINRPIRENVKSNDKSRRRPKRRDSRETVTKIYSALQQLAEKRSYSKISTNHIASQAEINISTIYQYFSSKEEIALALYQKTSSEVSRSMKEHVLSRVEDNIDFAMPELINTLITVYEKNSSVLLRMPEELPELHELISTREVNRLAVSIGRVYIGQQRPDLSEDQLESVYQFLANSTLANIRQYLVGSPFYLPKQKFVNELSTSISSYIKHAAPF
ncbi:TetR/AcrR family transcriptional regulator [Spongiibacter sp. KMU-166]|uniref:TetR/AcrR family transcriptional regulator n=1 Tax=Spongiibacter thalassae TaxID=2721624 RepID=A0ABX1GCL7_9GAMM|nr:TetR/AcrR family transcriptional regulator [Spongiibacter thalassae]NKI16014.1 TetR/AcrR family transcriptional regulator [Spongiibacter thalassae]